jgi:hypothetical protein
MKGTPTLIKRQLLLAGLIAFMVVLLTSVSATVATSRNVSPAQLTEAEPNDDFDDANLVYVPGFVTGSAWNSVTDTDYFVMETTLGEQYRASVNILYSDGLALRMVLYNGDRNFLCKSVLVQSH